MVTGRASHTRLEEIGRIRDVADDQTQPAEVRELAQAEYDAITAGGPVHPALHRVTARQHLAALDALAADESQPAGVRESAAAGAARVRELEAAARADELERIARQAVERARTATKRRPSTRRQTPAAHDDGGVVLLPVRSFVYLWDDLDGWWDRYDPNVIGPALTVEQWAQFERAIAGTLAFADTARTTRDARNIA